MANKSFMKSNSHFTSGINGIYVNFPDVGEFETIVLIMKVTLVKAHHYAHNTIALTSNLYWG